MSFKAQRDACPGNLSKILVTGGAGYIGSVVCRHLREAGLEIVVLDDLRTGRVERLPAGVTLVQADLACRASLDAILPEIDVVVHLAASIDVEGSMRAPIQHFVNNTAKCLGLLEAMLDHGVSKFIFSSTAAIYGQPRSSPITEDHVTVPENPYGDSKLMVEKTLEWLHQRQGFQYASLRYFNAAGGRPPDKASNLIPLTLEVASGRRPYLAIYGNDYPTRDGTAIRDYVHVEDLASAHLLALQALERFPRQVYNVGTGTGHTVLEVVESARRVSGHPIPIQEAPRRPGDPAETVACAEKIQKELGWSPRFTDLDRIIESSWSALARSP